MSIVAKVDLSPMNLQPYPWVEQGSRLYQPSEIRRKPRDVRVTVSGWSRIDSCEMATSKESPTISFEWQPYH